MQLINTTHITQKQLSIQPSMPTHQTSHTTKNLNPDFNQQNIILETSAAANTHNAHHSQDDIQLTRITTFYPKRNASKTYKKILKQLFRDHNNAAIYNFTQSIKNKLQINQHILKTDP